jgi:phage baseplate assembly protein W
MSDLSHLWGNDLAVGTTGDVAVANGTALTQQRLLRRLLTNPGDYIWQPKYGAGLPQFVGTPAAPTAIQAVIRGQLSLEASIAQTPEPVIDVQASQTGTVYVQIRYVDNTNGSTQLLTFSVDD